MQRNLDALRDETFDVVILGGGITGAGVALDAATRGWRVALIDKGDFASGTSSASSKLIHGGLRYLEQAHLHLVYEALQERRRLLHNAPHLVRPLAFVLPFYEKARVPRWKWRLGLSLYDLLAGRDNLHRSRPVTARWLARHRPELRQQGLAGGAIYYDAQMDDSRLCLAVLETAAQHGAILANYVEAIGFEGSHTIRAREAVSGRAFLMRGRQVLNATGPWVDAVCRLAGDASGPHLQPTKGVHVIAPARHGDGAFLLLHPRDGRVFFVLPWYGKTLIGTTDTLAERGPDDLQVKPEEIAYLLEGYNEHFLSELTAADLLGSFAGLRPLIRSRSSTPSSLSREYRVFTSPGGLVSVAGGKYTTFRQMAEEIVDLLALRLDKRTRCRTRDLRLAGAPAEAWEHYLRETTAELQSITGDAASAHHLLERHGSMTSLVLPYLGTTTSRARIHPAEPDLVGELAYQRDHEMALFPADHLLRRSRIGLFHPELLSSYAGVAKLTPDAKITTDSLSHPRADPTP
jgi:glycerol-3-phosphate dehydrogenase